MNSFWPRAASDGAKHPDHDPGRHAGDRHPQRIDEAQQNTGPGEKFARRRPVDAADGEGPDQEGREGQDC